VAIFKYLLYKLFYVMQIVKVVFFFPFRGGGNFIAILVKSKIMVCFHTKSRHSMAAGIQAMYIKLYNFWCSFTPISVFHRGSLSLVFCVVFWRSLFRFSLCLLSFGHCIVSPSSIYGFWLPIWYLESLLTDKIKS
jgi:hypothetical protein